MNKTLTLADLVAETFEPYLGKGFVLVNSSPGAVPREIGCELVEVKRSRHGGRARQPFSLLFCGHEAITPAPGFHSARCGELETPPMFVARVTVLEPRADDAAGAYYEAVFN